MTLPLAAGCDIIIMLFLISCENMIAVLRFVYSGRTKKEESWEDGADFLPFEQLLKVTFVFCMDFDLVSYSSGVRFCSRHLRLFS